MIVTKLCQDGNFNESYVQSFFTNLQALEPDYTHRIVPYNMLAIAYNLVGDSMQASVAQPVNEHCGSSACDSYLFTGGLIMTTPWTPTGYESFPLTNIYNLPAMQIEFMRGLNDSHVFTDNECAVYGSKGVLIGIKMCVAERASMKGGYLAGKSIITLSLPTKSYTDIFKGFMFVQMAHETASA
jgi:hypothetical protein